MQKKVKTKFGLSLVALSLGFAPVLAHADTNAQILKELKALQAQVEQLQAKVQAQDAQLKNQGAAVQAQDAALKAQQGQVSSASAAADDASTQADHNAVQITGLKSFNDHTGMKGMTITGMIAPAYIYNQDQQSSSFVFLNRLHGSTPSATSFTNSTYNYDNSSFGQAYIQFQKVMGDGTKWTLNLAPDRGNGANMNYGSIINEASVSMPINGDDNTRFIAGQIPDWEGYEYVNDSQTYAVTHNLLFDFTELFAYTGVGVDISNGDNLEWKAMIANVNSSRYYYDNGVGGRAPALVARFDYSLPGYDSAGVGGWGMVGKLANSAAPNGYSTAAMAEFDGYLNKGAWGWYGQVSYGKQAQAAYNGGDAKWWGLSAMSTYNFTPRFLGFARADYLNSSSNGGGLPGGWLNGYSDPLNGFGPACDANGVCTADGAKRYALSLGINYQLTEATKLKLEYRYDGANIPVFQNVSDGSFKKNNSLLAAGIAVNF